MNVVSLAVRTQMIDRELSLQYMLKCRSEAMNFDV